MMPGSQRATGPLRDSSEGLRKLSEYQVDYRLKYWRERGEEEERARGVNTRRTTERITEGRGTFTGAIF
jgi:hypothetical protein